MKTLNFTKYFEKALLKITKEDQLKILEKLETFKNEEKNLDIKKLQPKNLGYYRLRVGKYRLIYETDGDEATFLNVDSRDSIYL